MAGLHSSHLSSDRPRALALLSVLAILIAAPALPQTPGAPEADPTIAILEYGDGDDLSRETDLTSGAPVPEPDIRAALSGEMAQMRRDIADIARFARWQDDLARITRTDPDEALRQRLPMADCLASLFAPICDDLTGLFKPEDVE